MRALARARGVRALAAVSLLRVNRREAVRSSPDETNSPLFHSLVEGLDGERHLQILDLGPASSANIAFFAQYRCRLHIEDCLHALAELRAPSEDGDPPLEAQLDRALQLSTHHPFDVILVWDLLNYLDRPVIKALAGHLAPAIGRETLVHAYLYPRQTMPERPNRFRITEQGRLVVESTGEATRRCPCYRQPDLEKLMAGLTVRRSMLLKNGIQEYLFGGRR